MSERILFPQLIAWDNLWLAARKAARGKRGRAAAATFEFQLADNLLALQAELSSGTYRPLPYTHFYINEPKQRKISAAPFRDRVVHHALCNLIEPIFEARFHPHSYANRVGKGTHRAVDQLQQYTRHYRYVLRCDIKQHFPSIDHQLLKQSLFQVIQDQRVRALITTILSSGEGVLADQYDLAYFPHDSLLDGLRPRGLPIGNLTSQFWSNCYLNDLDWFVSRELGCAAYVRYVDDFALFSDNKQQLWQWKIAAEQFLSRLRLRIHHQRAQVIPVTQGVPWLGFVVFPTHRRLKQPNVQRFQRRLSHLLTGYYQGRVTFAELDASIQGWINHVRYADTWQLREHVLQAVVV